jgi:hypothetical protein
VRENSDNSPLRAVEKERSILNRITVLDLRIEKRNEEITLLCINVVRILKKKGTSIKLAHLSNWHIYFENYIIVIIIICFDYINNEEFVC